MYPDQVLTENCQHCSRGLVLCLVIIGGFLLTSFAGCGQSSSANSQGVSKIRLSVEDPRPVAMALAKLEAQYGWVITYEDPRYVHSSDIADVTLSVRRDLDKFKSGEAPKVLIPKGGTLTIDYEVMSDTNLPSNPAIVVQELLNAQAASPNAGRFRREDSGRIMHVIPTAIRNSSGELVPQKSVLETMISLTAVQRTGLQKLESICAAIRQATKIPVVVGTIPQRLFLEYQDQQGAAYQRARDILANLLETVSNGTNLSWQLFYDPGLKIYALNIHQVPKHNG